MNHYALAIVMAIVALTGIGADIRANDAQCTYAGDTLAGAAASANTPKKGCCYSTWKGVFGIRQSLPNEHAVLAIVAKNDAMGDLTSFLSGDINAMSEKGKVIFVDVLKDYADGDLLDEGIYVYDGYHSYVGTDGATHNVRAFHQMREDVAKVKIQEFRTVVEQKAALEAKQAAQEKAQKEAERRKAEEAAKKKVEEEDRAAKPVTGERIELPSNHQVRSICGIEFGVPPAEAEKNLGARIEGRPIAIQLDQYKADLADLKLRSEMDYSYKFASLDTHATYMLKKPFRNFDRVRVSYTGGQPYCVVDAIELLGYVQPDKVNKKSCIDEMFSVAELLRQHYGLGEIDKYRRRIVELAMKTNHECSVPLVSETVFQRGRRKIRRNGADEIVVTYMPQDGEFRISISKRYEIVELIEKRLKKENEKTEAAKANVGFSADAGADVL